VLDQEYRKEKILQESRARQARTSGFAASWYDADENKENDSPQVMTQSRPDTKIAPVKRDFFGRVINEVRPTSAGEKAKKASSQANEEGRIWVSFHEGFSNAVRKPITLKELLDSF
jgi:chromosome transmission fidelity protein 18